MAVHAESWDWGKSTAHGLCGGARQLKSDRVSAQNDARLKRVSTPGRTAVQNAAAITRAARMYHTHRAPLIVSTARLSLRAEESPAVRIPLLRERGSAA
jgi:hypothetical protein